MVKPEFDELIHAPTRLTLVSLLAATAWAEFRFLRDSAGLSDSALSKQLTTLEEAGYLEVRKTAVGRRARTSARLTPAGRLAFAQHAAALQEIVARAGVGPGGSRAGAGREGQRTTTRSGHENGP